MDAIYNGRYPYIMYGSLIIGYIQLYCYERDFEEKVIRTIVLMLHSIFSPNIICDTTALQSQRVRMLVKYPECYSEYEQNVQASTR